MIRLVAIDLDGTLLDDAKKISESTVCAIKCLPQSRVKVVIASARPPRSVRPTYDALGLNTWQINYNGAMIWDEVHRQAVFHVPMEPAAVRTMIDFARQLHPEVVVSCEVMDRWFTDRHDEGITTETGKLFKPDVVGPIERWCDLPITKLMLLADPKTVSRLEASFTARFGQEVGIVRTDEHLIQVMNPQATKAVALEKVADHYGVPMEQVMAIGDNVNDISMINRAGVGIAMANADARVKSIADWVAPSNNADGVHAALKRYGLCR